MKRLMLDHAFGFVNCIQFFIGQYNLRSRRAIEKLGASLVERIERDPAEGSSYSAVVYEIKKAGH